MLSKILSLTIEHNIRGKLEKTDIVVNCFQKSYLWLLNTTDSIAKRWVLCCELLSKILSLTIEHNPEREPRKRWEVVNCFQKSYLWLLNTTHLPLQKMVRTLWIAFKNLIFDYWTQPIYCSIELNICCELLSKILSLTIEHNSNSIFYWINWVVNCFQKSYLWLLNTTEVIPYRIRVQLWIAFKNLIFDYWTQQNVNWI